MSYVICCLVSVAIGFIAGWVVRAKNQNSDAVKNAEDAAVDIAGKFKDGEK